MAKAKTKEQKEVKIVLTEGSINRYLEKTPQGMKKVGKLNKPNTKLAKSVIAKAARYKELDTKMKAMKKEMDEIKEFFMAELKDKELDFLMADIYKVCYSKSESLSFNAKEFEAKHANLYEEFKTKLSITEKVVINQGK